MLDVGAVAAALVQELLHPRPQGIAPVRDVADQRVGDLQDPLRAAGEVEVVVDVSPRERAERGRSERLHATPGARDHVDLRCVG